MKSVGGRKSLIARPAVLVLDAPPAEGAPELEALAAAGIEAELMPWGGGTAADWAALERADFILTWHTAVDEAMVRRAGRAILILHYGPGAGRGVARVALEAARETGIYVASVPDYATESWAGETLRLMRLLTREMAPELTRRDLAGLRLGVIGFGQVGRRVAQMGRARKMEVWACDPFAPEEPFLTGAVKRCDLATLCGTADIVTLHVPLGPATRKLVGEDALLLMKREALLINTADPELVDLDALAAALERRRPVAAAFDEDLTAILPAGHPLLAQPRLVHGPRRTGTEAASAEGCRRRVGELMAQILGGRRPGHLLIDPPCPRHILLLAQQDQEARK